MKNLRTTATAALATAWLMTTMAVFSRPLTVTFPDSIGAEFGGSIAANFDNTDGAQKVKPVADFHALIQLPPPPEVGLVWKQHYNVSDEEILNDTDGDGYVGWAEAAFGTDPHDARSAARPVFRREGAVRFLEWSAAPGTRQQVESSPDLLVWQPVGEPLTGNGALVSVPLTETDARRYFHVLALPALDSDGDGLDSIDEGILGTDPRVADSDRDGVSDFDEAITLHTDPLGPVFVLIPAGTFQMGDSFGEGYTEERPVHPVNVSAFFMQAKETTKVEWDEVRTWALANGYTFDNVGAGKAANHPVQEVSWNDVVKWCNAKSQKEALIPCYYTNTAQTTVYKTEQMSVANTMVKWSASGYRLPTEAEWEKRRVAGSPVGASRGVTSLPIPWPIITVIHPSLGTLARHDFTILPTKPVVFPTRHQSAVLHQTLTVSMI